jgi:hypothetical protein
MIIYSAPTRLYDEDILATNRVFDLAASLANGEFTQYAVAGRDTEHATDAVGKSRVGIARKDDDIPDHLGVMSLTERRGP